jgi:hypothetical protein
MMEKKISVVHMIYYRLIYTEGCIRDVHFKNRHHALLCISSRYLHRILSVNDVKKAAEPIFLPVHCSRVMQMAHLFLPVYIMTIVCKSCGRQRDPHFLLVPEA